MADYFTLFSVLFPVGTATNVAPALALYQQFADELEEAGEAVGFLAEADKPSAGAELWLHSDESGDVEHVIAFVLRCAEAFDLKGLWGFRWALTCSKLRLDGFGGGGQLLDLGGRRSLGWTDAEHWLLEEAARLHEPANTAAATFNAAAATQGWTGPAQTDLLLSFVGQEMAANPAVANRFQAFLHTVSADADGMTCRECGRPMFIEDNGVSYHEGDGPDGINHTLDRDHVAVADQEPA